MKCVIMAGGFGTRLRPLTNTLPKPMVPMVNRPIMDHIVELLESHSIKELISLLYFHPESISGHIGDGSSYGVTMDYITATEDLGTAGAVAAAMRSYTKPDTTLVISGDVLTDINLKEAVAFHKKRKSIATIVLTRVENPLPFGIVITNKRGKITRFLEKPGWGEVFSDTINTGIYILEKEILKYVPEGVDFDFGKELFPLLLEKKCPIYGHIADGYWKDVGSLEEYRQANLDILEGRVKVSMPGKEAGKTGVWVGENSRIDFTSSLEGSVVIGADCHIGPETRIVNSTIGSNCTVEEGAVIIDSVIWDNVSIGSGVSVQENVIANDTEVKAGAHLSEGVIVSDHCQIGRNATVKANVKVWPHKTVDDDATLASSLIWGQRWSKNIFSTYGVTGLANIELSPEFAAKLGAAYGATLKPGAVVSTSRDAHKGSRMINRAVMTGILSTGVDVHDYGVVPMPVCRFLARSGNERGGIHARRSPFDPLLLDLKFFDTNGLDLHPGFEKTIEKLFFREDFNRVALDDTGELSFPVHGFESYQNGFMSVIDVEAIKRAGFKVAMDYSYGSSSRIFPALLGQLNCEVISLNANLDGTKVTRTAEEFEKAVAQLSTIGRSLDAHVGFLLDSGGEKIFLVDDSGEAIDGETALNLVTLLVLKCAKRMGHKGAISVPVTAPRAIDSMAKTYGFEVKRTKTSPHGLMAAASSGDNLFVGETTGGFIFPRFQPVFDGMYAIVKILEMLAVEETTLHRLLREIPPSIIIKDRVPCAFEHKGAVMRKLAEDSGGKDTLLLDGIKINFKDNWVAAYPSQDHPYFHVMAEASTDQQAKDLISEYTGKIKTWQKR